MALGLEIEDKQEFTSGFAERSLFTSTSDLPGEEESSGKQSLGVRQLSKGEIMSSEANFKYQANTRDEAINIKMLRLVEDSDLSLYQIASLIRISGTTLTMWMAGTVRPPMTEVDQFERIIHSDN